MKTKQIIKNTVILAILGIILGIITEVALIINCKWLINITQSFIIWGLIISIIAIFPKKYILSILNPAVTITFMNVSYYIVRLIKSGYTNIYHIEMYTLTGIAGALYIGTAIYIIKNMIYLHNKNNKQCILNLVWMTIFCIISIVLSWHITIRHNLFYNIDIGIIIGFLVGTITTRIINKRSGIKNE